MMKKTILKLQKNNAKNYHVVPLVTCLKCASLLSFQSGTIKIRYSMVRALQLAGEEIGIHRSDHADFAEYVR